MNTTDHLLNILPANGEAISLKSAGFSEKRQAGRLVAIGFVLALVVGAFAYLGGWFTPHDLTPIRFVDGFERVDGVHHGYRRNHAKGLGVSGYFESNGRGAELSKAAVFLPGRIPVIARFSLSGGQPKQADKSSTVRGMAIEFPTSDGELWRTAMVNLPVFPVRTPEAFYERLLASKVESQTGLPNAAKMNAFLAKYPEAKQAMAIIKSQPFSTGFENSAFHALNSFYFVNSEGKATPVRWMLSPVQRFEPADPASTPNDDSYLFHSLAASMRKEPLKWRLVVIVGEPDDPIDDASAPWPEEREKIDVGTLTLDTTYDASNDPTSNVNFDPLVLPSGIEPSNDPLLSARSAVYSQSYTRRETEKAFDAH